MEDTFTKRKCANGYPIAMFAFGMSSICLGIQLITEKSLNSLVASQALFFGGLTQTFTGIFAYYNNDILGLYLSMLFSGWWYTYILLNIFSINIVGTFGGLFINCSWAVFFLCNTCMLFFIINNDIVIVLTFASVVLTVLLGIISDLFNNKLASVSAGCCILAGVFAFYVASSHFLKEIYGYEILPIQKTTWKNFFKLNN